MSIDALHEDIPFLFIMAPSMLISEKISKIWSLENTFEEALPFSCIWPYKDQNWAFGKNLKKSVYVLINTS